MNTLIAVAIYPVDAGKEGLSVYVWDIRKVIKKSGLYMSLALNTHAVDG
jgi:uncharacterized protein YqgV (UPF0045/DUF77 family)